ncbi:hypothetical protein [Salinibacterium sp. ZJ454]|uniref:hypothetical protein n=1 Tax=Salinibacterium sp. ZJ454 TaxID=2708339 RepID=UPI0014202339|nr:hypothetical protein [Salinibacterium sp. ZJ454]
MVILILTNIATSAQAETTRKEQARQFQQQLDADRRNRETNAVAELLSEIQTSLDRLPADETARNRISALATILWLNVKPEVSDAWRSSTDDATATASAEHPLHIALRARTAEFLLVQSFPPTGALRRGRVAGGFGQFDGPLNEIGLGSVDEFRDRIRELSADLLGWESLPEPKKGEVFDVFLKRAQADLSRAVWFANRLLGGTESAFLLERVTVQSEDEQGQAIQKALRISRGIQFDSRSIAWNQEFEETFKTETLPALPKHMEDGRGDFTVSLVVRERGPQEVVYVRPAWVDEEGNRRMPVADKSHGKRLDTWFEEYAPAPHS